MILISVPHSSEYIPDDLKDRINLEANFKEISEPCITEIVDWPNIRLVTMNVHQCFSNVNRFRDNINKRTGKPYETKRGVITKFDFHDTPLYLAGSGLSETEREELLKKYYDPFYRKLEEAIVSGKYELLIDAHAMNSHSSSYLEPDKDPEKRPDISVSNNGDPNGDQHIDGAVLAFPPEKLRKIAKAIKTKGYSCKMNDPFRGGVIIQTFASRIPCIQLEINKNQYMTDDDGEIIEEKINKLNKDLGEVFNEEFIAKLCPAG